MLGKIEGKRRRGWQRVRWLNSITNSTGMNLSKLWKTVKDREAWHAAVNGVAEIRICLSDGTTKANTHDAQICTILNNRGHKLVEK